MQGTPQHIAICPRWNTMQGDDPLNRKQLAYRRAAARSRLPMSPGHPFNSR
jgi:hypothetical protein